MRPLTIETESEFVKTILLLFQRECRWRGRARDAFFHADHSAGVLLA